MAWRRIAECDESLEVVVCCFHLISTEAGSQANISWQE
jgi:hypothetical protein